MKRLLLLSLLFSGCAAHKMKVDPPAPIAVAVAKLQPPEPIANLLLKYKPAVRIKGTDPADAIASLKMGGATEWHGWVFLGDHTFGFLHCEIEQAADGSATLHNKYTPVGKWSNQ